MTELNQNHSGERGLTSTIKDWVMIFLTLGFVVLYGLALLGTLKPLADASVVMRLEPIIFVFIGYYFGRLPSQQNEQSLKAEIDRQINRADAAQQAKESALQSCEVLDEKIKNARTALAVERKSVETALGILRS